MGVGWVRVGPEILLILPACSIHFLLHEPWASCRPHGLGADQGEAWEEVFGQGDLWRLFKALLLGCSQPDPASFLLP